MSSSPLSRIRVKSLLVDGCVDEALRRELAHILSGDSDHEGPVLEASSAEHHHPTQPNGLDTPPSQPLSGKRAADKARRQRRRAEAREKQPGRPYFSVSKKYAKPQDMTVDFNVEALPAAKGAFVSQRQPIDNPKQWTLDELMSLGYRLVEWDGRYGYAHLPRLQVSHPPFSTPVAVLDAADRIMVALAGRPDRNDWDDVHARMSVLMEQAGNQVQGTRRERRGEFISLFAGVSYGGGQKVRISEST